MTKFFQDIFLGCLSGIIFGVIWGWAMSWAIDDDERLIREGRQDPRTAILPITHK